MERLLRPTLYLFDENTYPSLRNLPLQLNGLFPTFRYRGYDCSASVWAPWGYGESLSVAGSGADLSTQVQGALLGDEDTTMKCNGGKYLISGSTSYGNLGASALCFEVIFRTPSAFGSYQHLINKRSDTSPFTGWEIALDGSGNFYFYMKNASGNKLLTTTALVADCIYHALIFVDPAVNATTGSQIYINGAALGSGVNFNGLGSCDNAVYLKSGANLNLTPSNLHITYMSLYKGDVGAKTSWDTVAKERFQKLTGIYANIAKGTPTSTFSRDCPAYVDKWVGTERKFYKVSPGWPRWCQRKNSTEALRKKFFREKITINNAQQSRNMPAWWTSNMTWVAHSDGGPFGSYWGAADTDNTSHNRYVSWYSGALPAGRRCVWIKVKKGAWGYIILRHTGSSQWSRCFNVNAGAVGSWTQNAPYAAGIIPDGGGHYLCYIVVDEAGCSTSTIDVFPVVADGPNGPYTGVAGTERFYMSCAQSELGEYPTSLIETAAGSATRLADFWTIPANDGNFNEYESVVEMKVLSPNYARGGVLLEVYKDVNNRKSFYFDNSKFKQRVIANETTTGAITDGAVLTDGVEYKLRAINKSSWSALRKDDAAYGTGAGDTVLAAGLTTIALSDYNGANQTCDLISDLKVLKVATTRG